jgi:hypothetical protein
MEGGSAVERRDRSALALLEIGAAVLLFVSFAEPWFVSRGPASTIWISAGGLSVEALTLSDLLVPFAAFVSLVVAVAGFLFPARGVKVAILTAFGAALYGAILVVQEVMEGDAAWLVPPTPAQGLWLFTAAAVTGVALAVLDLVRGGSSTFAWRALRSPSMKRSGPWAAYVSALLITLPVAVFPMDPHWWRYVWIAALLAGPLWAVRSRLARK